MNILIGIILVSILFIAITVWELPTALAPAALCFSMPRRMILPSILIALAAGVALGLYVGDFTRPTLHANPESALIAMAVGLAVVGVLRLFGQNVSFFPAVTSAIIAYQLIHRGLTMDTLWIPAQWIGAMVAAALLGMIVFRIIDRILSNSTTHLLTKLSILGSMMSVSVLLMIFFFGINLSEILAIATGSSDSPTLILAITATAVVITAALSPALRKKVSQLSDETFDADATVSISCVIASLLTMAIFLRGTTISPAVITLCALAGARNAKTQDILMSVIVAPAFAFALSFAVCAIAGSAHVGMTVEIAEAIAGLLAMTCCALVAQIIRMKHNNAPKGIDHSSEMAEGYRRLNEMKIHSMQIENEHLQNLLEIRRRDALSIAERISEQSGFIDELFEQVTEAESENDPATKDEILHAMKSKLSLRRNSQDDRSDFYSKVETLHQDFSARLTEKCPQLSAQERKLATLLRLEFSSKYIAALLNISPKSVEVERHRLRRKLGLSREQNLIDYIKSI